MVVIPHKKTFSQWTSTNFHPCLTLLQIMHSQPSNERPTYGCDLQQIPLPPSSSWERHRTLCHLLIAHLKRMFHLEHIDIKGNFTIGMFIMWHNGMFIRALALGWILCLSSISTILTLCSIWTWRTPVSPIILTAFNCIGGPKVKLASWVDKIMLELG